ncbi:MAG: flagellar basal-body MS-ring/collar protein FliF [Candidatus Zixiibacteriota bacterium]
MREMWAQFLKLWTELSLLQKGIAGLLVVLTIAFSIGMFVWSMRPDYQVLYSGLSLKESGQIVEKLNEDNVQYKLDHGGRSILVESKDIRNARVALATSGIPKNDQKGYELFDESKFGTTRFEQEINLGRAKEAELAKSINEIDAVNSSRVHIVMPQRRTLGGMEEKASASVVLNLFGNIDPGKIDAIRQLVSAAIDDLDATDVVIIDSKGNLLAGNEDKSGNGKNKQLELQAQVEDYYANKAQKMLDIALGTGNSVVKVSADLDFRQIEQEKTTYDPDNVAVLSEEKTSQKGEGNSESDASVTNFEVPMTVERIVGSSNVVKNLKIAVLLNYEYEYNTTSEGIKEKVYSPRTDNEINKLGGIVQNAIGFDPSRGDQFQITSVPFDDTGNQEMQRTMKKINADKMYKKIAYYGLWALLGIIVMVYIKKFSKKIKKAVKAKRPPKPAPKVELPKPTEEETEFDGSDDAHMKLKKKISEFANDNPHPAADLVRSWLMEGE